jgi:hypothetical protein
VVGTVGAVGAVVGAAVSGYRAIVSEVSADGRYARATLMPQRTPTRLLAVLNPFSFVVAPVVGQEVVVLPCPTLEQGVILGWLPAAGETGGDRLVVSTSGGVPTQTDPSQAIGNAALSTAKAR